MAGQIQGTTHLCQGQEAVSVGAIAAMQPGDVQTNTYRGHGEALALGMDARDRLRGADGSLDRRLRRRRRLDAPHRLLARATSAPTPSSAPACRSRSAPRVAFQMQGKPNVALTFFGDGATNIGTFHEALNMAADLEGARSCSSSPTTCTASTARCGRRPRSTTWPAAPTRSACPASSSTARTSTRSIAATVEARRASPRAATGPSLLEMKTYRYRGHSPHATPPSTGRPASSRRWKARDPIDLLGASARRRRAASAPTTAVEIRNETQADIDAAAERAAAAPVPDPRGDPPVCLR